MKRYPLIAAAILLAVLQIGFLSFIIGSRAAILQSGKEVLLKIEPVDPRDLLRGDYIIVRYEVSSLPVKLIAGLPAGELVSEARPVFLRLRKDPDGYWRTVSASLEPPAAAPASEDEADIQGAITAGWTLNADTTIPVSFGIERFYVPEGEGRAIESDLRERPFGIRVALARDGTPQIKALVDGNKVLFEEPIY